MFRNVIPTNQARDKRIHTNEKVLRPVPPSGQLCHDILQSKYQKYTRDNAELIEAYNTPEAHCSPVKHGVCLLAKTVNLCLLSEAYSASDRMNDFEKCELTDKRKDDNVICNESKVKPPLSAARVIRRGVRKIVGYEKHWCKGVRLYAEGQEGKIEHYGNH